MNYSPKCLVTDGISSYVLVIMNLEERHWERLLADIQGHQVVPVIGPELLVMEVDGETLTLHDYLARELVKRLDLEGLPEHPGFHEVVGAFQEQQPTDRKRYEKDEIYYQIRSILEGRDWPVPEPLRQLAEIRHFELFVSTTFDTLMEQALDEVRGANRTRSFSYCKMEKVVDLPDDFRAEDGPAIFHFFGKVNPMNDFSVTDEDILEYAHRLQSRDLRPHNLFDQFRNKRLLTLGCSFPGWLTRFFLAAAKGDELFTVGVSGFLADELTWQDKELVGFLKRKRTEVCGKGGASEFVAELHKRWTAKFGKEIDPGHEPEPTAGEEPPDMPADSVFISFLRNDRDMAREVAARFRKAGIDVWFDETNLSPGDRYERKIARHIFNCFAFVPLISQHSIERHAHPEFYRFEWNKAIEAAEFRPKTLPFFLPVIVDDTNPKAEGIPQEFRDGQMLPVSRLDEVVNVTRDRIRDRRRERRAL